MLVVVMIMASSTAFGYAADHIGDNIRAAGFESLTPSQQASILKDIADTAEKTAASQGPIAIAQKTDESIEAAKKWVGIGTAIGSGLASTAKELGMVANDFVKTPVGTLAAGILIWKFIGKDILQIFGGLTVWIIGFTVIRMLFNATRRQRIVYSKEKTTWFGKPRVEEIIYNEIGDYFAWWIAPPALVLMLGLLVILH